MDVVGPRNLLLIGVIVCVSTTTTNSDLKELEVTRNGSVADESLVTCGNKSRIKLVHYEYKHCATSSSCGNPLRIGLSSVAERVIHEMCSLKKTCVNGKFPLADLQSYQTTIVNVSYKCLDEFTMFVDICTNSTKQTDSPAHMVLKENSVHLYERCQCQIDSGSLTLSDIRLKSASSGNCSLNKIQVNSQVYSCNATSDDYGSVFGIKGGKETDKHFVGFAADRFHVEPEMVYFTIKPAGNAQVKISCQNKPWQIKSSTVTASGTNTASIMDQEHKSNAATSAMTGVGVCVGLLFVCVGLYVGYSYWNRKATKRFNYLERLVEMYITRSYNPSRSQNRACRTEDEGVYVNLKKSSAAVNDTAQSVGNGDKTVQSIYSKYDKINGNNFTSNDSDFSATNDSNFYSYATHRPGIRLAGSSVTSNGKIDYGRNGACGADGNCSTDDELPREKHKYVVLLPVLDSEAKSINDNQLNQGNHSNQNETRVPYTSRSKSSGVKKKNIFKKQGGTQNTKGYSFAVDPYQNSTSSIFNKLNKLNQTRTKASSSSQEAVTVSKLKDTMGAPDSSVFRKKQENSPNVKNNEMKTNTAFYNNRHETIEMRNLNQFRAPRDSKLGSLLQKVAGMVPGFSKRSAQQNIDTANKGNSKAQIENAIPCQKSNSSIGKMLNVDNTSLLSSLGHNQYDSTKTAETKKSDDHNYNHIPRRDINNSRLGSEEEHYDKTDGEKIIKINHPNYNKISMESTLSKQ